MNPFQRPQITDELLSAYLDGAVTVEEKALIEKTAMHDASVAWRLESLRQTVALLRSLPDLQLPRSFMLTEADVAPQTAPVPTVVAAARRSRPVYQARVERNGFLQSFVSFLQGGSPLLRNLATAGLTAWLILFAITTQQALNRADFTSALVQGGPITTIHTQAVSENGAGAAQASSQEVALAQLPAAEAATLKSATIAQPQAQDSSDASAEIPAEQKIAATGGGQTTASVPAAAAEPQMHKVETSAELSAQVADTANANPVNIDESKPSTDQRIAPQSADAANQPPGADALDLFAEAQRDVASDVPSGEVEAATASAAPAFAAEVNEDTVSASAAPPVVAADSDAASIIDADDSSDLSLSSGPQPLPAKAAAQSPVSDLSDLPAVQLSAPETSALQPEVTAIPITSEPVPAVEVTPMIEAQLLVTQTDPPAQAEQQLLTATEETVEVALVKTENRDALVAAQIPEPQQARQPLFTPILDPIRLQWAQFVVAMATATLALFWLASQRRSRSRRK